MSHVVDGSEISNANPNSVSTGFSLSDDPSAVGRLKEFFFTNFGVDETGSIAVPHDPFLRDVLTVTKQLEYALTSLVLATDDSLSACEHDVKYAGNVKSQGNKIYTPVDVARNALRMYGDLENKFNEV